MCRAVDTNQFLLLSPVKVKPLLECLSSPRSLLPYVFCSRERVRKREREREKGNLGTKQNCFASSPSDVRQISHFAAPALFFFFPVIRGQNFVRIRLPRKESVNCAKIDFQNASHTRYSDVLYLYRLVYPANIYKRHNKIASQKSLVSSFIEGGTQINLR